MSLIVEVFSGLCKVFAYLQQKILQIMTIQHSSLSRINPRFFETGNSFNRFLNQAAYLSRCSADKTAVLLLPRHYAIQHPYIQANRSDLLSWLIFDLDHSNPFVWADAGLPPPNFIVQNRKNGHSHLYYAITPVCTSENARIKPINYLKSIYRAFAEKLDADPNYQNGPVAKTPGHAWWTTSELHSKCYELGELADYVELRRLAFKPTANLEKVSHSRNCLLFEQLRHHAYSLIASYRQFGYEVFHSAILSQAERLNKFDHLGFAQNLSYSEIKATAKSVARWTFYKYNGNQTCSRGIMGLNPETSLKSRQAAAAARSSSIKSNKNEQTIVKAAKRLFKSGLELTRVAVSKLSNISRQTVAKHWQSVEKAISQMLNERDNRELPKNPRVKFAVHQVTALQEKSCDSLSKVNSCFTHQFFLPLTLGEKKLE